MKRYKVQYAYAKEIGEPVIHSSEIAARGEVAYLLGNWIARRILNYINTSGEEARLQRKFSPAFEEGLRYVAAEIPRLMAENKVWEAYDLWEEFYERFQNEPGYPLYVLIGTVIVEGSSQTGLKNRIPLLEQLGEPPMVHYAEKGQRYLMIDRFEEAKGRLIQEVLETALNKAALKGIEFTPRQFQEAVILTMKRLDDKISYLTEETEQQYLAELREGILRTLFPKPSIGLGAIQRWLVQYADFGGAWHAGRHMSEDRAKRQAGEYLTILIEHLSTHASTEAHVGRNPAYVNAAGALIERVQYLLSDDLVWAAYREYKDFERKWNHRLGMFPLEMAIGTMRVIPEPEPEVTA